MICSASTTKSIAPRFQNTQLSSPPIHDLLKSIPPVGPPSLHLPKDDKEDPRRYVCDIQKNGKSSIPGRATDKICHHFVHNFFNILDLDSSGYITAAKLRHVLAALNVHMDDQAMAQLVDLYDSHGSGILKVVDLENVISDLGYTLYDCDKAGADLSNCILARDDIPMESLSTPPTSMQAGEAAQVQFEREDTISLDEISDEKMRFALALFDSNCTGVVKLSDVMRAAILLKQEKDHIYYPLSVRNQLDNTPTSTGSPATGMRRASSSETTSTAHTDKSTSAKSTSTSELHWSTDRPQLGLAPSIHKVNHIALIVSDVGRSAAFYTNVMGFQQIRRPNFDRHGAWFTMGNIELHLIKGVPAVHSGDDLIVGHISIETPHISQVPTILNSIGVPFRQNVSVPKGKDSGQGTNTSADSEMIVQQYFVRDPDGYWVEICNCDVLTDYCLDRDGDVQGYGAGDEYKVKTEAEFSWQGRYSAPNALAGLEVMRPAEKAIIVEVLQRWSIRAREAVHMRKIQAAVLRGSEEDPCTIGIGTLGEILGYKASEVADEELLENLRTRMTVYADVCQNETESSLVKIVQASGNDGVAANQIMNLRMELCGEQKMQAPGFFERERFVMPPITVVQL